MGMMYEICSTCKGAAPVRAHCDCKALNVSPVGVTVRQLERLVLLSKEGGPDPVPEGCRRLVLDLDREDWSAVQEALARRQDCGSIPPGAGNFAGRVLAEVCRGWLEATGGRSA